MDLSSYLKALPVGLVMFAVMAARFFRRRAGHQKARTDYPALAVRLGLEHRAPTSPNQIGCLQGQMRGFSVLVDPDEQRKLIVRFHGEPDVDLRTYDGPQRPSRLVYYVSHDRVVDGFLKTRYASPAMAEYLDAADLSALVRPFIERYRGAVKQLNITQHGVTCVVDFGTPPHIPARAVEELLPALLDWAEAVEPEAPLDPGARPN
jgi:hypothetical protein